MLDTFSSVCLVLVPFQPNFLRPPLKSRLVKSIKVLNFMFSRSQVVTSLRISGGCLRMTPLSLMECLCSAPRTCHKSQLISPHKCHSSLILPHQAIMASSIMHCTNRDYIRNCTKKRQNKGFSLLISQKVKTSCQAHLAVVLSGLGLT